MLRHMIYIVPAMLLACATEIPEEGLEEEPIDQIAEEPQYSEEAFVINFGNEGEDGWYSVNDTVMGGVSSGNLTFGSGTMLFEGAVSTDSNGGFASVRSPTERYDLSMHDRVLIRLKSEGQPFSLIFAHNTYWWQDQFKVDIQVPDDGWHTLEIPYSAFQIFRTIGGYPTPTGIEMTPEDSREILHLELMSKLFEDGSFRLEVDFIAFD